MSTPQFEIRSAILGADKGFKVVRGGHNPPPPDPQPGGEGAAPVTCLGHFDGVYHFLDAVGQKRQLTARALGNRQEVLGLFCGDEGWLKKKFPETKEIPDKDDPEGKRKVEITIGWSVASAGAWLQKTCSIQGLYGDFLQLRRPGIWRGEDGLPVAHCGDAVLLGGDWRAAGIRTGNQVWVAAPPTHRPGMPCGHNVGQELHDEIQRLWQFKRVGGPALLVGLIGTAMLGLFVRHRPNGFLTGEPVSGKSTLMEVLRACCPMHAYTNNATEAGVSSAVNGRVVPIFIDESSDRKNTDAAEALMDMMLASSTGDGTKAIRGKADGGFRMIEMAGCTVYGSVNPPAMLPQHLRRVTLIEVLRAPGGEDVTAQQLALIEWARERGPSLWGRALSSAERWAACLLAFRTALAEKGCSPGEMDQIGGLLAGWWIMTRQGLPDATGAKSGVVLAAEYIRLPEDVVEDSGPRRAVQHLLSRLVQYDGTTRHEQVGKLLERAFEPSTEATDDTNDSRVLARNGMRIVRPCARVWEWRIGKPPDPHERYAGVERAGWFPRAAPVELKPDEPCRCENCRARGLLPVPRLSDDGGVWLMPVAIRPLFQGVHGLEGDRWQTEVMRIALRSTKNVRVGGVTGRAIWLPRREISDDG